MMMDDKPWLNRTFQDGILFYMDVKYICDHICNMQKERLSDNPDTWTRSKEYAIERLLDSGLHPDKIHPISLALYPGKEEFSVTDGITRLRVFRKRGIEKIFARLYHR